MKKIILLFMFSIFIFTSCKTGTIVIVPVPNIEIPIYPPQTNLSLNTNIMFNNYLGIYNFNNSAAVFFGGTNYLLKKNFVYLK